MKDKTKLKLTLLAGALAIIPWTYDHWRHTQALGLCLLVPVILVPFLERYGWKLWLCVSIFCAQSIYGGYIGLHDNIGRLHHQLAATEIEAVLTIVVLCTLISRAWARTEPIHWIAYLGFLDAIWICIRWFAVHQNWGMLNNSAADGTFIACCWPMLGFRSNFRPFKNKKDYYLEAWSMFVIMPMAVILTNQSTPLFCFVLGTVAMAWRAGLRLRVILPSVLVSGLGMAIYQGNQLMNPRGRFEAWRDTWLFMSDFPSRLATGMGSGTYEWLMPIYQQSSHKISPLFLTLPPIKTFLFAHNEYLQVFFEQGILGVLAMAYVIFRVFKASWRTPWLFGTAAAISLACLTQMPFRYLPFQILCVCVIALAKGESEKRCEAW